MEEALRISIQNRIDSNDINRYLYLLDKILDAEETIFIAAIYFYVERMKYADVKEYASLSTNEYTLRRYNYVNRMLKEMAGDDLTTVLDIFEGKLPFGAERTTNISNRAKEKHCSYVIAYYDLIDTNTGKWREHKNESKSKSNGIKNIPQVTVDKDVKSIIYTINAWTEVLKNKNKKILWDSVSVTAKKQLEASIVRLENILKEIRRRIS